LAAASVTGDDGTPIKVLSLVEQLTVCVISFSDILNDAAMPFDDDVGCGQIKLMQTETDVEVCRVNASFACDEVRNLHLPCSLLM
jgi:hypothetical protein